MKNIHVLQTDKPSRLSFDFDIQQYYLQKESSFFEHQDLIENRNIYITSDEEIKEGDWFIRDGSIHKCFRVHKTDIEFLTSIDSVYCGSNTFWSKEYCKKIILTTDQDLIKDGVQVIGDEFLEYFISVPFGEIKEVDIIYGLFNSKGIQIDIITAWRYYSTCNWKYKIIIPKGELELLYEQIIDVVGGEDRFREIAGLKPKQETLEEAAEIYAKQFDYAEDSSPNLDFIAGAKWQQENSYTLEQISKEFVGEGTDGGYFDDYLDFRIETNNKITFKEWFNQFKK